jgi:hypothetical protein
VAAPALVERLLAPATAVAVVIVVILLLIWINGGSSGDNRSTVTGATHAAPLASATATPSPHPAATARATATAAPTAAARSHASSPRPATKPASHIAMAPVTVLNNSRRSGLAAAVAAAARHKGWPIRSVGNLQGVVPETTVYFAPGKHAAAMHLASDFASVQRVKPNRAGHIHGGALTLVVTRYWQL